MTLVLRAAVTDQPIALAEHEALVNHQSAGAVVGFVGTIRDHDGGRQVVRLEYSAHPSAPEVFAEVVAEVAAQAGGVRAVAASHRIGVLRIGESRSGGRRGGRPSSGGVRHLRAPGRRHQGAAAGVEAPILRRRVGRMGGFGLTLGHPPLDQA